MGVSSTFSIAGTAPDLMSVGFMSLKYKSDEEGYEEPDPDKITSFNLVPKIGFLVINNLAVGLDLSFSFNAYKDGYYDSKVTETLFAAGPFVRYYFPVDKVKPFIEAGGAFGLLNEKYEYEGDSDTDKGGIWNLGGGVGMAVPIGDQVTFDGLMGFNSLVRKDKENNPDNERYVFNTFGLRIGFVVLLGSK